MVTTRRRVAPRRPRPDATLTASGERVDLTDRNLGQKINRQRDEWQKVAWNYRDLIGELGSGIQYEANIISKVSYKVGMVSGEDQPHLDGTDEFDKELPKRVATAAREALDRLPFRNGYSFTGIGSTCLRVSGEAWLHGKTTGGKERWQVLSSDEVMPVSNSLGIIEMPGAQPLPVDPDSEVLLRLWQPHPRWKRLADSPLRRMLDTCEDIVLIGRELRAVARSRVASNGILVIPNEVSLVRKPDGTFEDFQTQLEAIMLAPIANEGDPGAVVPVVLRGPAEHLEKVKHISLQREESPELIGKMDAALRRLREGMDMPPDANQSVKDMNHWSAWSVSGENWKNYLEPHARLWVDALTEAYLRPSLMQPATKGGWGLTEEETELVQVWYDAGNVTENANRSEDAKAAHDRGEIGGKAFREALGFAPTDAPDDDEFQRMVTWKAASAVTPEVGAMLLEKALGPLLGGLGGVVNGQVIEQRRGAIEVGRPKDQPGRTGVPTGGSPGITPPKPLPDAPAGVQGAGGPQGVLDSAELLIGDRLVEIERQLRDRLLVAADDAVLRALEKAGSRVRARAQKDATLAATVRGLAATDVCLTIGQSGVVELGLSEDSLLAKAFEHLSGKWARWVGQAVKDVVRTVADMLPLSLTDIAALTQRLAARIPHAWKGLEHRLRERALDKLYGRGGDEVRLGEIPDTVVYPGDIRAALAEVGGSPSESTAGRPTGLALGRDVTGLLDEKAERVGFSWKYGITPRERMFEPHKRLDTHRFTGWDDAALATDASTAWIGTHFAPGDHEGCLCDYVPTWARLSTIGLLAMEIEPETVGMGTQRLLAEIDDAAGRVGTDAQRDRDERDRILAIQRNWMEHAI